MDTTFTICPNCGGCLIQSPDKTHGICPYCDSSFLLTSEELEKCIPPSFSLKDGYLDIVRDLCVSHKPRHDGYLHVAYSLKKRRVFKKAKKYFLIPEEDDAFLIYDSTALNSFKLGFALCTSGIYYRDSKTKLNGIFSWKEFKDLKIFHSENDYLFIGNAFFEAFFTAKELSLLLNKIKDSI